MFFGSKRRGCFLDIVKRHYKCDGVDIETIRDYRSTVVREMVRRFDDQVMERKSALDCKENRSLNAVK